MKITDGKRTDTLAGLHRKATPPHYQSKKQHEGAYKNEKTVF